jgi:hypothetical protein
MNFGLVSEIATQYRDIPPEIDDGINKAILTLSKRLIAYQNLSLDCQSPIGNSTSKQSFRD